MTATKPAAAEDASSRPLRKDAARNRALLVAAAREVFASRGLDATLDDVARHANVGVGTAYRHFANKYELAGAILDQVMDEVVADAQSCLEARTHGPGWSGSWKAFWYARVPTAGCARCSPEPRTRPGWPRSRPGWPSRSAR